MASSLDRIINIADLRDAARRRLPRAVFDYLEGTADDGITGQDNLAAFTEAAFRPHQALTCTPDLTARILGMDISMPVFLSPIGYCRLLHHQGDLAVARAAKAMGVPYIQATGSGYSLEEVQTIGGKLFFQVYNMGGRAATERALARAKTLGFDGIFVTVDTPVSGNRECDPKNGMPALMGKRLLPKLPYVGDILAHPDWLISFLRDGGVPAMPNVVGADGRPLPAPDVVQALANANICWSDLGWIRKAWDGPIIVKGLMRADDALRALDEGANGIVVSNHGGRQLDTVAGTLRVLPGIAEAVKGRMTVFLDGGIRRGQDIVKALCLGADAVLVGRAYGYGLAAAGEAGVSQALSILRTDMTRTLSLLGVSSLRTLSRDLVFLKDGFRVD